MIRDRLAPFFAVGMISFDEGAKAKRPLLARLLEASRDADVAEKVLADARSRYGREPSPTALEKMREASIVALEKELRFEAIWKDAAETLLTGKDEDKAP